MGISRGPKIVSSGLVLCLDTANKRSYTGTGTTWRDLSGVNNNSTLTNGPTFNALHMGSIVFDGVDDYISVPHAFDISSGGVTFNIWFKLTSTSWSPLIADWPGPVYSFIIQVYSGTLQISIRNPSGFNLLSLASPTINANVIYNVQFAYDKTTKVGSSYINGILYDSQTSGQSDGAIANSANTWSIGLKQDTGNVISGNVYLCNIYNRSLTASEVLQNYNATRVRFGR
jgi:hypothetical protein